MGNAIKCKECEQNKIKNYTIKLKYSLRTEFYSYPTTYLGRVYIPKNNTQTNHYLCSNGHKFEIKEKCV
jgi:hypothetical protein